MINIFEVNETNKMIEQENLDVRTITLGISLLDCIDPDLERLRERIYEKVWGGSFMGDTRTLDSHIQRLRKKLGWENYIRTVFRIGYRLEDDI